MIAGTVLSHVAKGAEGADPHINFSIRPAGKGAPRIDPKPILDGWKLLEATAIYRAKGKNPFNAELSGAGVLLLSKEALQQRVLADKGLDIYQCGREDIEQGKIDRRVLAVLEYLRSKGFTLRISALECGHSILTEGGNVSEHSTGDAVDIAEIDGVNVTGHQGPGTLVHELIEDVLQLQGPMQPHQVISLEDFPGEVSFAEPSHYDHVHIGYRPIEAGNPLEAQYEALLKPNQWEHLIDRLGKIENPTVPIEPSKYSLPDQPKRLGRSDPRRAPARRRLGSSPLSPFFGFAQFDFAGILPLADGRYLARREDDGRRQRAGAADARRPTATLTPPAPSPRRPRPLRRRRRCRWPGRPRSAPSSPSTAPRRRPPGWRRRSAPRRSTDAVIETGIALVNDALHAHAVAAADPYVAAVTAERAVAVRVGFGSGDETAEGAYREAHEVDVWATGGSRRGRRQEDLRPQERVAAVLRGRERLAACEPLLLRARADLDAGRRREAALQLRVGVAALLAELPGSLDDDDHRGDIAALEERRGAVEAAAERALQRRPRRRGRGNRARRPGDGRAGPPPPPRPRRRLERTSTRPPRRRPARRRCGALRPARPRRSRARRSR